MNRPKKNILIINRFNDEFANYSHYIDAKRYRTHFITTKMIPSSSFTEKLKDLATKALRALEFKNEAFHLEVIHSDINNKLYFLEVGARVGGGEIPFVHKKFFNIDLYKYQIDLQLNQSFTTSNLNKINDTSVGFILPPKKMSESEAKRKTNLNSLLLSGNYSSLEKLIDNAIKKL